MDSSRLVEVYQRLLSAARTAVDGANGDLAVNRLLCHLVLFDGVLAAAARSVAAGTPAVVDNADAMCADQLGSMVARYAPADLLDLAVDVAANLAAAVEAVSEDRADTVIRVSLYDRYGGAVLDEWISWRDVLEVRVSDQLPRHARYIARLVRLRGASG